MIALIQRVTEASVEVEDEVATFSPDIVFLDVGMPGRSGYEVARALREGATPGLTIVAVTGWGQPEDRHRTLSAGFDHHLVKPPDIQAIIDICRETRPLAEPSRQ